MSLGLWEGGGRVVLLSRRKKERKRKRKTNTEPSGGGRRGGGNPNPKLVSRLGGTRATPSIFAFLSFFGIFGFSSFLFFVFSISAFFDFFDFFMFGRSQLLDIQVVKSDNQPASRGFPLHAEDTPKRRTETARAIPQGHKIGGLKWVASPRLDRVTLNHTHNTTTPTTQPHPHHTPFLPPSRPSPHTHPTPPHPLTPSPPSPPLPCGAVGYIHGVVRKAILRTTGKST